MMDDARAARDRLETALVSAPMVVFEQDRELRYTWIHNPSLANHLDQLLGKRDRDIFERLADAEITEALKREVLATGEGRRRDVVVAMGGRERWYDLAVEPRRGPDGAVIGVSCVTADVTSRVHAESARRASDERLQLALRCAGAGIWEWEVATNVVRWSPESCELYGRDPALGTLTYAEFEEYVHPDDLAAVNGTNRAALGARSQEVLAEARIHHPRRGTRWIESLGRVESAPDGTPIRMLGVNLDVTDRRNAEEAQRAAERRLQYLVRLGDALREVADPVEVQRRATRLLGEHLGASRVHFSEVVEGGQISVVHVDHCPGLPSMVGRHRLDDYGPTAMNEIRDGRALIVNSVPEDPRLTAAERAATAAVGAGAYVVVPLVKMGELVVFLAAHRAEPGPWTHADLSAIEETAARTWADVVRARAEAALRRSEQKALARANELQALLDAVPAAVFITRTADAKHVEPNRYAAELLRMPLASNVSLPRPEGERPPRLLVTQHGIEVPAEQMPLRTAAATRCEVRDYEFDILFDDGESRRLLGNASPLLDHEGRAEGAVAAFVDVTGARRAEAVQRETEARFRRVFESAPTGIAIRDSEGKLQDVNPAFSKLVGYTPEELRGMSVTTLVHPDDLEANRLSFLRLEAGELTFFEEEGRYLRKDGQPVWTRSAFCLLPGETSSSCMALVTDITQRREAEEALRRSEESFSTFFDTSAVGTAEINMRGRFIRVNDHLCQLTGYSREELLQMRASDLSPLDQRAQEEQWLRDYLGGDDAGFEREKIYVRKDGRPIWVQVTAAILRDAAGQPLRSARIIQDVTDRRRAEEALRESNEKLREADRRKTEFLGVLSHELRNPLAPIRNSIYLLDRAAPGSTQATRAKEVLRRQTEHLTRLVDDLLDVTRISHGKMTLQRSLVDLREIVRKTADDQRSLFQRRGVELRVEQEAAPVWVEADAARVTQILSNLLQNAVKFTLQGGTVVIGTVTRDGGAVTRVRDTGIGIEREQMERMFEPFAQADQSLARTRGGLGLGLAVARGLVELHGGTILALSEGLGLGAELIVTLPLAAATGVETEAPAPPSGMMPPSGLVILVIEDNVDAGQSLADVLSLQGHRVHVALDGHSGLKLAHEIRPGVVICDIGLPDLSGHDVARALRQDESLRHARLIALSGYAQPEDVRSARAAGFDTHVAKPATLDALARALGKRR